MRNMPAPALRAYVAIRLLTQEGAPPFGGLDDEGAAFWVSQVAPRGLDEPYDPAEEKGWTDAPENEEALWKEWRDYAEIHGRPLESCRDLLEFMVELGLIDGGDDGTWVAVSPLPHVEDVLPLAIERKEIESQIRWRQSFAAAGNAITAWLTEKKTPGVAESEIETSLQAIAANTGLDLEDARHGLALLLAEDIRCNVDPETAARDQLLGLRIDWRLFEEWRTVYRAPRSGADERD
jgi:hypothetical protein